MGFTVELEYTPRCPQPGKPFTEASFSRQCIPFNFDIQDIGIALVDLWNIGWEDGPFSETLGLELSFERGRSHAIRKRQIIEHKIAPTVNELRGLGVQIFHCNHVEFLQKYPQWLLSITAEERERLKAKQDTSIQTGSSSPKLDWPPSTWVNGWRAQHEELIWGTQAWQERQGKEVYPHISIPTPVEPQTGDLLIYSREQFHRLLTAKRIRALFYMGFETDECLHYSDYGIANMQDKALGFGYLCTVVRDCTATYELAETLEGLWKTRLAINSIETRYGYSITAKAFLTGVRSSSNV